LKDFLGFIRIVYLFSQVFIEYQFLEERRKILGSKKMFCCLVELKMFYCKDKSRLLDSQVLERIHFIFSEGCHTIIKCLGHVKKNSETVFLIFIWGLYFVNKSIHLVHCWMICPDFSSWIIVCGVLHFWIVIMA